MSAHARVAMWLFVGWTLDTHVIGALTFVTLLMIGVSSSLLYSTDQSKCSFSLHDLGVYAVKGKSTSLRPRNTWKIKLISGTIFAV